MLKSLEKKSKKLLNMHLSYFMDVEFESTGQLFYRYPGYCLITLEVIFPFLRLQQAIYECGLYTSVTVRIRLKENTVFNIHIARHSIVSIFFHVNQVYFHKRNPSTRSYASSSECFTFRITVLLPLRMRPRWLLVDLFAVNKIAKLFL